MKVTLSVPAPTDTVNVWAGAYLEQTDDYQIVFFKGKPIKEDGAYLVDSSLRSECRALGQMASSDFVHYFGKEFLPKGKQWSMDAGILDIDILRVKQLEIVCDFKLFEDLLSRY